METKELLLDGKIERCFPLLNPVYSFVLILSKYELGFTKLEAKLITRKATLSSFTSLQKIKMSSEKYSSFKVNAVFCDESGHLLIQRHGSSTFEKYLLEGDRFTYKGEVSLLSDIEICFYNGTQVCYRRKESGKTTILDLETNESRSFEATAVNPFNPCVYLHKKEIYEDRELALVFTKPFKNLHFLEDGLISFLHGKTNFVFYVYDNEVVKVKDLPVYTYKNITYYLKKKKHSLVFKREVDGELTNIIRLFPNEARMKRCISENVFLIYDEKYLKLWKLR